MRTETGWTRERSAAAVNAVVELLHARERGDARREAAARAELARLGIALVFADSPRLRSGKGGAR